MPSVSEASRHPRRLCFRKSAWLLIMMSLVRAQQGEPKKRGRNSVPAFLAPLSGFGKAISQQMSAANLTERRRRDWCRWFGNCLANVTPIDVFFVGSPFRVWQSDITANERSEFDGAAIGCDWCRRFELIGLVFLFMSIIVFGKAISQQMSAANLTERRRRDWCRRFYVYIFYIFLQNTRWL